MKDPVGNGSSWELFWNKLVQKLFSFCSTDKEHDDITLKVYRRLLLRHSLLNIVEKLSGGHVVNRENESLFKLIEDENIGELIFEDLNKNSGIIPSGIGAVGAASRNFDRVLATSPKLRACNLAATDLFVEKALTYLNRKARKYDKLAKLLILGAFSAVIAGIFVSFVGLIDTTDVTWIPFKFKASLANSTDWKLFVLSFIKSFTFFGLLVLFSVYCYRMAKALFDQAERIKDRRHALRQGRLFVHLNGGKLTVDELEKAFNWNVTQENAFSKLNPEAQAPMGALLKELMITLRETPKANLELIEKLVEAHARSTKK